MDDSALKSALLKVRGFAADHKILLILAAVLIFLLWIWASGWLDHYYSGKFWKERQEMLAEIERINSVAKEHLVRAQAAEEREVVLESRNALLKKQNEEQAELLSQQDAQTRAEAAKIDRITDEFDSKLDEILNTPDRDQKCKACAEAREIGVSFSFCGGCP